MAWLVGTIAVVVVAFVLTVIWLEREKPRHREKQRRERDGRIAAARRRGWRAIGSTEVPAVVEEDLRGPGVWLSGTRRLAGAEVWMSCHETWQASPGGNHLYWVTVHLRPRRGTPRATAIRLAARGPVLARLPLGRGVRTGDEAFDRRYRVVADDAERAVAALGEDVRTLTLRQRLTGWRLRDGILTVRFDGVREPGELRDRFEDLGRLARALSA